MTAYTIIKAEAPFPTDDILEFAVFIGYQQQVVDGNNQLIDNPESAIDYVLRKYKDHSASFAAAFLIERINRQYEEEKLTAITEGRARVAAAITIQTQQVEL